MAQKNLKPIPRFKNEAEEQEFWSTHSSSDYFSIDDMVQLDLSELKPTSKPITLRLPTPLIYEIKVLANSQDVPYQSLMKVLLANAVRAFKKSITE